MKRNMLAILALSALFVAGNVDALTKAQLVEMLKARGVHATMAMTKAQLEALLAANPLANDDAQEEGADNTRLAGRRHARSASAEQEAGNVFNASRRTSRQPSQAAVQQQQVNNDAANDAAVEVNPVDLAEDLRQLGHANARTSNAQAIQADRDRQIAWLVARGVEANNTMHINTLNGMIAEQNEIIAQQTRRAMAILAQEETDSRSSILDERIVDRQGIADRHHAELVAMRDARNQEIRIQRAREELLDAERGVTTAQAEVNQLRAQQAPVNALDAAIARLEDAKKNLVEKQSAYDYVMRFLSNMATEFKNFFGFGRK